MLRYSCDVCGKDLVPDEDRRYIVKIEVTAAHEPMELTEDDLDADAVESLSQMLTATNDETGPIESLPPARREFRYDLCPDCHQHYVRNPLAREAIWQFSDN